MSESNQNVQISARELLLHIMRTEGYQADRDAFAVIRQIWNEDRPYALQMRKNLNVKIARELKREMQKGNKDAAQRLDDLNKEVFIFSAQDYFEDFMFALEWNRPPRERFYMPRRKVLRPLVNALQDLADDKLDELFLSMPPRVGKSTTVMFYLLWNMCRDPERSNLYVSYSDIITNAMYSGLMEIIQDSYTYNLGEIFPFLQYPNKANGLTNAKEETIDFARKRRYHTLTCRSLYGTLNGATDCNGLLVSDDLISGIEEAMNRDRMVGAWQKVANNMLTRAKEKAKVLWVGTRWSLIDPIGLRQDILENDPRFRDRKYRILNMPALNDKDMSNFEYEYGVGFSTAHFHQIRAAFERNNQMSDWNAQYMQMPIERESTVFAPDDMRFYNGVLPDDEPDRKFMCVDPAWGGGDFVASPVCYQYGDDVYVVDVVYNNGDKKTTQPEIVYKAKKYDVRAMQIESTKTTASYKEGVEDLFRADQYRCQITTRFVPASKSKEQKIFDKAPDIREHFVFLEDGKRSKEYQMFMQNVFSFKITGKNKHDDAPDSLTMASDFAMFGYTNAIQVFKRPF